MGGDLIFMLISVSGLFDDCLHRAFALRNYTSCFIQDWEGLYRTDLNIRIVPKLHFIRRYTSLFHGHWHVKASVLCHREQKKKSQMVWNQVHFKAPLPFFGIDRVGNVFANFFTMGCYFQGRHVEFESPCIQRGVQCSYGILSLVSERHPFSSKFILMSSNDLYGHISSAFDFFDAWVCYLDFQLFLNFASLTYSTISFCR